MSPLSIIVSCMYISTVLYDVLLSQSGKGHGYFWQVNGYKQCLSFIEYVK